MNSTMNMTMKPLHYITLTLHLTITDPRQLQHMNLNKQDNETHLKPITDKVQHTMDDGK